MMIHSVRSMALAGLMTAYDPYFGIRVQAPKVSSLTFQNYVGIRQMVRISDLTVDSMVNWDDWVTMGVLVDKTPVKTSASGSQYCIWKLSDLIDCQRIIRLLLFGDSAKEFWKLKQGDVVAVMNARKMENKADGFPADKANVVTLKIDNKKKIVELGICPDYDVCKGIRKQDNQPCTNFVNKSKCLYCDFHLLSTSKRLAAQRGEFQLGSNVPPKKFNNPVKKVLPGSNLRTSRLPIKGGVASAMDMARRSIKSLPTSVAVAAEGEMLTGEVLTQSKATQVQEAAMRSNTIASRQVLCHLARIGKDGGHATSGQSSLIRPSLTCKQFLFGQKPVGSLQANRLMKADDAKAKAIATLRARGTALGSELQKSKSKPSGKGIQGQKPDGTSISQVRPRLLGQLSNLSREKLKELADKKSSHEDELTEEDAQRQEAYFKVMEVKEKVDQRATEVMALKGCKVATCKTCKYTWHTQSELCKQNGHVVRWHMAEKRFFKCRTCGTRTVAYDKYPSKPCQCGSTTFVRVAMREESKGPQLARETLKIRGDEEAFLNC